MKKIALFICVAMILTMAGPFFTVFGEENKTVAKAGYIINQNFDDIFNDTCKTVYPAAASECVSVKDGTVDLTLSSSGSPKYSAVMATGDDIDFSTLPAEYVIDFDLNVINCSAPFVVGVMQLILHVFSRGHLRM